MTTFLIVLMLAVILVSWAILRERFQNLEERMAARQSQIKELSDRLTRVERSVAALRMSQPPVVERAAPVHEAPAPAAPSSAPIVAPPAAAPIPAEVPVFVTASWRPPVIVPPIPTKPVAPSPANRLRALLGNDEWEALVGGSLLNKIGAVVLVIGIALFLAYSFGRMSAAAARRLRCPPAPRSRRRDLDRAARTVSALRARTDRRGMGSALRHRVCNLRAAGRADR